MFKELKTWPWTDKAREIWWMAKFTFYALLITGALVLADWVGRTWLH